MMQTNPSAPSFHGLGIAPSLLEVLGRLNYVTPTPIQAQAIPIAISGKDVIGIAQTGTGKTLAFGIPMIQRLAQLRKQGLVVLPTRELALQVDEVLVKIGRSSGLRTAVLIGGASQVPQVAALRRQPHIIIATPGRLIDLMEQKKVSLGNVGVVVLDEADRMMDMGFLPQLKRILAALPKQRQTMLFSATMPPEIMKVAAGYMQLPTPVEIAPTGTMANRATHELYIVDRQQKEPLLEKVLEQYRGSALVFTRTKYGAKKVARQLRQAGLASAEIHSNRTLNQRREALDGFKSGKYRVLVATDIASRGIDVVGIELVVNYDLPSTSDDYVHRIGRTARASANGHAITFAMPSERQEVKSIERLIRKPLPVSQLPPLPLPRTREPMEPRRAASDFGRQPRRGGRPFQPRHSGGGYRHGPSHRSSHGGFGGRSRGGR